MSKEKKQMMVLGVLALVIVGVGAFQFLGGKPKEQSAESEKPASTTESDLVVLKPPDSEDSLINWDRTLFGVLDKRDPFKAQAIIVDEGDDVTTKPQPVPTNPGPTRPKPEIGSGGNVPVDPGSPNDLTGGRALGEPPFDVAGIIQGSHSTMAILRPDDGPQRVVSVGDSVGNDMTIVTITSSEVTVRYKGKYKTLKFRGGN